MLERLFSPPDYGRQDTEQKRIILQATSVTTLVVGFLLGLVDALAGFDFLAFALFLLAGTSAYSLWSLHRGRLLTPSVLLPLSAILVLNANMILGGSFQEPGALVYLVVIIYASLLLGKRAALIFAGLSIFSEAIIFSAVSFGMVPNAVGVQENLSGLLVTSLLIAIAAGFLWIMLGSLDRSVDRARTSEARWRSLVENAPATIINTDAQGRVQFFNRLAWGDPQDLIGSSLTDFVQGEEHERALNEIVLKVLSSGESDRFELTGWSPEGGTQFYSFSVGPIKGQNGEVEGLTFIVLDITEKKQDENEIRRLNTELEKLLQERTEQLKISNEDLAAFSYSISHDLRTPLRAIDGFTLALLEDFGDQVGEQGQGYINRARAASQNMGDLIDDLLRLAWIIRQEVKLSTLNLSALAISVTDDIQTDYPERQVNLNIQPQMEVYGDKSLLRIALDSLFRNAWKFTEPCGQTHIEFGCQEIEGAPTYFVRDNGVGFDMRFANKLFQPFQHLHSRDEFEGSGIGLAIANRIIQKHGGEIWAEGEENQGATFYFTLSLT